MAYKRITSQPIIEGGTAIASATVYAPLLGGVTSTSALQSASAGISNSGYLLTSNGSSSVASWQAGSGGGSTGTFIPILYLGGVASDATYSTNIGEYFTIGNIVFFTIDLIFTSKGTSIAGLAQIGPLPFTSGGGLFIPFFIAYANLSIASGAYTCTGLKVGGSPPYVNLSRSSMSSGNGSFVYDDLNNNSSFYIQGFYFTS